MTTHIKKGINRTFCGKKITKNINLKLSYKSVSCIICVKNAYKIEKRKREMYGKIIK